MAAQAVKQAERETGEGDGADAPDAQQVVPQEPTNANSYMPDLAVARRSEFLTPLAPEVAECLRACLMT